MFEQETAVLVHVEFTEYPDHVKADFQEFELLAKAAGALVARGVTAVRKKPDPRTFIGSGKIQEIAEIVHAVAATLVLFNHDLTPSQERNISEAIHCRVLSRTGLILDIFAQRARTYEGKLQVELAQLKHLATRLVGLWTHLERQKGGIGLRGPGETQLETDRRLIKARIQTIEDRLERVRSQREQNRRTRIRATCPLVALVGYTNAGKSTLFNKLTGASVFVADQLFATLDPTLRAVFLPGVGRIVLADTVGFIKNLPHHLVDAFRATLEETAQADVLLHVIDASDPEWQDHCEAVESVLKAIGASEVPMLFVYNKVDLIGVEKYPRLSLAPSGKISAVWISARTGTGLESLFEALTETLSKEMLEFELTLSPWEGALRAMLFEIQAVQHEHCDEEGKWHLHLRCSRQQWERIAHNYKGDRHGVE